MLALFNASLEPGVLRDSQVHQPVSHVTFFSPSTVSLDDWQKHVVNRFSHVHVMIMRQFGFQHFDSPARPIWGQWHRACDDHTGSTRRSVQQVALCIALNCVLKHDSLAVRSHRIVCTDMSGSIQGHGHGL